jgi:hypothetical protein
MRQQRTSGVEKGSRPSCQAFDTAVQLWAVSLGKGSGKYTLSVPYPKYFRSETFWLLDFLFWFLDIHKYYKWTVLVMGPKFKPKIIYIS